MKVAVILAILAFQASPVMAQTIAQSALSKEADLNNAKQEMIAAGVNAVSFEQLNGLGYRALYDESDAQKALKFFRWALLIFPEYGAAAEDSMGEAYIQLNDREQAMTHFAIVTASGLPDPADHSTRGMWVKAAFENSTQVLHRLKTDPNSMHDLQGEMKRFYLSDGQSM